MDVCLLAGFELLLQRMFALELGLTCVGWLRAEGGREENQLFGFCSLLEALGKLRFYCMAPVVKIRMLTFTHCGGGWELTACGGLGKL